jgi:hypothetical protein
MAIPISRIPALTWRLLMADAAKEEEPAW